VEPPAVFAWLARVGNIDREEMFGFKHGEGSWSSPRAGRRRRQRALPGTSQDVGFGTVEDGEGV